MSGLSKAIGKVFKTVAKNAKWIIPAVALGAAVVFTGGAALGVAGPLLGTLGGLGGAAATTVTGALGLTAGSALSTIVGGAVSGSLYGAALGGVTSLVTGGKVLKGIGQGALYGAATGGIASGIGAAFGGAPAAIGADGIPSSVDITPGLFGDGVASSVGVSGSPLADVGGGAAPSGRGMLGEFWEKQRQTNFGANPTQASGGGFFGNNGDIIGSVIKGAGQGMAEEAKYDAEADLQREVLDRRDSNYRSGATGLLAPAPRFGSAFAPSLAPNPRDVAAPTDPQPALHPWDYEWVYDKQTATFAKVPRT